MSVKYDDVKVTLEPRETRESHLLLVHIPEGFQRQNIGAKVEFDYGRVRVYGELPPENNVIRRFTEVYKVPETCDINNIRGKLEGRIVTITMPKREISEVPEQESQPPAQEAPKTPVQETEPKPDKGEEGTPPQPQPGEYQQEEEPTTDEEGTPPQPQPGEYQQQEPAADEEGDQKDQEGLSEQGPKSPIEKKEKAHIETPSKPAEAAEKSMPEMDQKWVPPKATFEDSEREEIEKKSFEQGKQPKKAVLDKSPATEEENNKKRKASSALGTSVPNTTGDIQEKLIPELSAKRMTFLEDKQKLIYMGAALAVAALGVYVTYKLRSSARK